MKITLEKTALLKSLGHIQSVVEKRGTIPILSNVLIKAGDNDISFTATDLEVEIDEVVPGNVIHPGAVTAPAHILYDIVRRLPDGAQVELSANNPAQLSLSSGRSQFKLGCLPVEDFPKMPEGDFSHSFSLTVEELRTIIDRTRFAISTEDTRYYLNGIYFHTIKSKNIEVLRAVATDGHRLARIEMVLPKGAKGMPGIIVPRKTIAEVRKLLEDANKEVEISLSENKIRFAMDGMVISSKLIDGSFPEYERVIPTANDKHMDAKVNDFAAAVDRVAAISTEKSRAVKMKLSEDNATLLARSPEAGSATEEVEVDYEGTPFEIGFNSRYLLDILQQINGENVRFSFSDSASPVIIHSVSDTSALYVIMPMRV